MDSDIAPGPRHFIYPLNPASPYWFEDDDGRKYPTDYDSFSKLLDSRGRDIWGLSTNYRRVEDRDYIWSYFSFPDGAIRGVGRVRGDAFWKPEWERHAIRIEWDRRLTKRLGREPIEYSAFGQKINAAITEANEETLKVLERWLEGRVSKRIPDIREVQFVTREIRARQGQPRFRNTLMKAYDSTCVITGCTEPEALEAAHIKSVRRQGKHSVGNGLLLRADIHTLFDRGLIVIDNEWTVRVHPEVDDETYRNLDGTRLTALESNPKRPTKKTLWEHCQTKGWS